MPTALLVEDEPFPRAQLKEWLATLWPELRIVGEAADGPAGLLAFEQSRPDVAFVDIRLPGLDGLELARHVANRAHVVFVTAFDEHAIRAFEVNAVDYLLKPVSAERFAAALERVMRSTAMHTQDIDTTGPWHAPERAWVPVIWLVRAVTLGLSLMILAPLLQLALP